MNEPKKLKKVKLKKWQKDKTKHFVSFDDR